MRKETWLKRFRESGDLKGHANAYLDYLSQKGLSPKTVYHQYHLLRRFIGWCDDGKADTLLNLTLETLEAYQVWLIQAPIGLKEETLQPKSARLNLQAVKRFLKWCQRTGDLFENPAVYLTLGKSKPSRLKECLTEREINSLLSFPDPSTKIGLRDKTMLEVLYSTGIRKSELLGLDLSDIDFPGGILTIRNGKGNKQRLVPIGERALDWTKTYLAQSRPKFEKTPHSALFLSQGDKRVDVGPVTNVIQKAKDQFHIKKWGNAHLIRHTMATLMLRNGADLRVIQEILGHSRINSTLVYTHLNITDLKKVHQKTHPAEQGTSKGLLF